MTKNKKIFSVLLVLAIIAALVPSPLSIVVSATEDSDTVRYAALILDTSGSMEGTPASVQKQAAIKFCTTLLQASGANYVAIIRLNTTSSVGLQFTNDLDKLKQYINGIPASGGTNIEQALSVAGDLMDNIKDSSAKDLQKNNLCNYGFWLIMWYNGKKKQRNERK